VRFRDTLSTGSRIKFLAWWLLNQPLSRFTFEVSLLARNGDRLFFRNRDDYGVAYEVFLKNFYEVSCPRARVVLDLGGHAGFTTLYFARRFPEARIVVMEPDHYRANQIRKHLRVNHLLPRVDVLEAAASTRNGKARLSAMGSSSYVGTEGEEVQLVDVFSLLPSDRIDILKMDIEGGEYEILGDPRFEKLAPPVIAMEWHRTAEHEDGREWCIQRLQDLGYEVRQEIQDVPNAGNLIAVRVPS
jgi:FkbM family methyltransferase